MRRDLRRPDLSIEAIGDWLARAGQWLRENETISVGGGFVVLSGLIVAGYLAVRRPPDVLDPNAVFVPQQQEVQRELKVNWPLYGLTGQRTRYLPAAGVHKPFRKIWKYDSGALMEFSPIYANGRVYGENNDAKLFALDAETGSVEWKRKLGTLNASSPAYDDGRIYAVTLEPGQVVALDADNGRTIWKRRLPGRVESSPVIANDRVFVGCEDGKLRALNVKNGQTSWETDVGGRIKAAPALDEGTLYVGAYGGRVSAVRARDGKVEWSSGSSGSSFARSGNFYSTPTVAFGRVYIGNTDGRVYSYDARDGDVAWSHSTGAYVYASPAIADTPDTPPSVYIGSYDGQFYALDARNGHERWSAEADGRVNGAATVIGETVYFASLDERQTIGVNIRTGRRVVRFTVGSYNPVISDGQHLYVTGYSSVTGMEVGPNKKRAKRRRR